MGQGHPQEDGGTESGPRAGVVRGLTLNLLRALGAALIVLGFAAAYLFGLLPNALFLLMILMAPATLLARLWGAIQGRLEFGLVRHPLSRGSRPYLLQCLSRCMFWGMAGVTLALALVPIQFEAGVYLTIWVVIGLSLALLLAMQLIPPRRIRLLSNIPYALGGIVLVVEWLRVLSPHSMSDGVVISPPFRGEWYVIQGGRSALINHTTRSRPRAMPSTW
jgi:hypothetical protein